MNKLKGKYEVILGFVTLVISLSAFKDELAKVTFDLGYTRLTLASYFLYAVYGFSICLYLYILEHVVRDTKIGSWKIFDHIIWIAFMLFSFILLTPILLFGNVLLVKIYYLLGSEMMKYAETFFSLFTVFIALASIIVTAYTTKKQLLLMKKINQQNILEREIIELENASKLLNDGYYSHSVLESFKVLETHLFKELTGKDLRVPKNDINKLIELALQNRIISKDDIPAINDIRAMRNSAAHTDAEYTKQHAGFALSFVKELLKRNG